MNYFDDVKKELKDKVMVIVGVFLAIILIVGLLVYQQFKKEKAIETLKVGEETEVQKQLRELDRLRAEAGIQSKPLTEEEVQQQLSELDKLRKEAGIKSKPLTEEEVQKQLQELDALRAKINQ